MTSPVLVNLSQKVMHVYWTILERSMGFLEACSSQEDQLNLRSIVQTSGTPPYPSHPS